MNAIVTGNSENSAYEYLALNGVRTHRLKFDRDRDIAALHQAHAMVHHPGHNSVVEYDTQRKIFHRPASYDQQFYSEQAIHDCCRVGTGDRVLDVGGNVGLYSIYAVQRGAPVVAYVEPWSPNRILACANFFQHGTSVRTVVVDGAMVPNRFGADVVQLSVNRGAGKGMHSLVERRNRAPYAVPAVRFEDLCLTFEPTVLKVDIEGGEYMFLEDFSAIPLSVTRIFLEFHLTRKSWRDVLAPDLYERVRRQFTIVQEPQIAGKRWTSYLVGAR